MAEALRLKTKVDYETVIRVATALRNRSPDFTEVAGKYINRTQEMIRSMMIENDALTQLDLLIAEALEVCRKCSINEVTASVNLVDTYHFDTVADQLNQHSDVSFSFAIKTAGTKGIETDGGGLLPCCVKGCTKNVPKYLSDLLKKKMLKTNTEFGKHQGLCDDHHQKLNRDQSVKELPMKQGGMRQPTLPRGGRGRTNKVTASNEQILQKLMMDAAKEVGLQISTDSAPVTEEPKKPVSGFSFSTVNKTTGVENPAVAAAKATTTVANFEALKEYLRQNPDKAELVMNSLDVSALGVNRG
jgi:hypothetical protein